MSTAHSLSATIVVPTRHEEGSVGSLLERIHYATVGRHGHIEVLFIDDSDNQETVEAIHHARRTLRSQHLLIDVIHRSGSNRTNGLAGAIVHGIMNAKSDHVVNMDADLQHPPEQLPVIIEKVKNGADIVSTSRYIAGGSNAGLDGTFRKFVSRAAGLVARAFFPKALAGITDSMTGYFAVKREKLDLDALAHVDGFKILLDILARHPHLKRIEIPLKFAPRHDGKSKAGEGNGLKFLKQLPALRMATLPSFASFLLGGGAIAAFGAFMLWALVYFGVNPQAAFASQLVVTVVLNFIYNKFVTWKGQTNGTLKRQMGWFAVTRAATVALSYYSFPWLVAAAEQYDPFHAGVQLHSQVANAVCLVGSTVLNFVTSKMVFEQKGGRHIGRTTVSPLGKIVSSVRGLAVFLTTTLPGAALLLVSGASILTIGHFGFKAWLLGITLGFAILSLATASLETNWRLYGRRTPEARSAMLFPEPIKPADTQIAFSYLVAGLREQYVLGGTLHQLMRQTHERTQVVVTLVTDDDATIAVAVALMNQYGPERLLVVHNRYAKGGKAAQLNYATQFCWGEYICPVDAETFEHEELGVHVEALIRETGADVVQCGVQLTNLDVHKHDEWNRFQWFPLLQRMLRPFFMSGLWAKCRGWFAVHNVLEYFFWWSSRALLQAANGFLPFGGNSIYIRKSLLEAVGGWPEKLTEDAFLGTIIAVRFPDVKIVAAYDPRLVAREETPPHIFGKGGWLLQRVRWVQGFIEVLQESKWHKLPTFRQRVFAFYTLAMPLVQGLNGVMLPIAIAGMLLLKAPVGLVLLMFSPFIPMLLTLVLQMLGLREFSRQQGEKTHPRHYLSLVFGNPFYQWLLALAAVIAIKRHIAKNTHWEKTEHKDRGSHKTASVTARPQRELVNA